MNQNDRFVIVTQDTEVDFTRHMIRNNDIYGILPAKIRGMDGKLMYEYDVSDCEQLGTYWTKNEGKECIEKLMIDLIKTIRDGQEYLLVPQDYVVEADKIFVHEGKYKFAYVSGYDVPFDEQLSKLMEYFMGKISHRDRDLVVFVYGLYNICKEQNGNLLEIEEYVQGDTQSRMEKSGILEDEWETQILGDQQVVVNNIDDKEKRQRPGVYIAVAAVVAIIGILAFI